MKILIAAVILVGAGIALGFGLTYARETGKDSLHDVLDEASGWEDDSIHSVDWNRFLRVLRAGADARQKDDYGRSVLWRVVNCPVPNTGEDAINEPVLRARAVEELLKRGASLEEKDADGQTVLMLASAAGNAPMVKALLKHNPNLHAKDAVGNTALLLAVTPHTENLPGFPPRQKISYRGHLQTVKLLLNAGAEANVRNKAGKTALMLVQESAGRRRGEKAASVRPTPEDKIRRQMAALLKSFGAK